MSCFLWILCLAVGRSALLVFVGRLPRAWSKLVGGYILEAFEMRGRLNRREMKHLFSVMVIKCLSVLFFLATAHSEGTKVPKIGNGQRKYQSGHQMDKDRRTR
jgi:hypothetical protein